MVRFLAPGALDQLPTASAVRDLYLAAAAEPPLSEPPAVTTLFADLDGAALANESVSVAGIGNRGVWLQTTDDMSPTRRLYEAEGFGPIGYGPVAPNGIPGLVMFRSGDLSQKEVEPG